MKSGILIFDLDGTLIDSREDLAAALNTALLSEGLPTHSVEAVAGMVGHGAGELVRRAVPAGSTSQLGTVRERFFEAYGAGLTRHTSLFPGMSETLDRLLAEGWSMSIATNKPRPFTEVIFETLGLRRWFRSFACGDEAARKPAPDIVRLAAERAGEIFTPDQSAYVGDMLVDLHTAQNAGCRFVGVAWGFGAGALEADPAVSELARRPSDLTGIFRRTTVSD